MGSIEIDMDKQQGDIYDIESNLDKPEPDMDELKNDANEAEGEIDEPQCDIEIWLNAFKTPPYNNNSRIDNHTCFTFESLRLVNQRLSRLITR